MAVMTPHELRERAREFANRTRRFCARHLHDIEHGDAARQLSRAAAAVSSGYRSVCQARSHEEFIARMGHLLAEADECAGWTQYLDDAGVGDSELKALLRESIELCRIFGASLRTARSRPRDQRRPPNRRETQ